MAYKSPYVAFMNLHQYTIQNHVTKVLINGSNLYLCALMTSPEL